ncbi:hypothetical protein CIHG_04376 [Coccidioides immitis H538.4]|uniref:Uncharacterized protein n=2 Tax=Coccidioides immitis TaxID=5501 RepID=A0A0J8U192_COCIT|nr:hypothetical protein CISG_08459 [Coccidioides immitis RMSCC 3703]KMU86588.1 hypothetical protein CIHG_04376 [Coccidioides immitis H538.4]
MGDGFRRTFYQLAGENQDGMFLAKSNDHAVIRNMIYIEPFKMHTAFYTCVQPLFLLKKHSSEHCQIGKQRHGASNSRRKPSRGSRNDHSAKKGSSLPMPALLTAEENICPGPRPYQIMPYTRLFTHQSEEERQKGRHRTLSATARWTSLAKNFVLIFVAVSGSLSKSGTAHCDLGNRTRVVGFELLCSPAAQGPREKADCAPLVPWKASRQLACSHAL